MYCHKCIQFVLIFVLLFLASCLRRTPVGPFCRSCKPYFCRTSWYFPQKFYEYDKVGLASWYGGMFHGRRKATGEIFNKMDLTAAHRTLPLPCVVRVTSLMTGRSVVLVVDDRGPFVYNGRIIDLSYGAASVLGINKGPPSPVRIQSLVLDSLRLSHRMARKGKKDKRTAAQIYRQEIARSSRRGYSYTPQIRHKILNNKKRIPNKL